jgi:hypothetical protein
LGYSYVTASFYLVIVSLQFFKHHCPSCVGIPSCETTQAKTCTRTDQFLSNTGYNDANSYVTASFFISSYRAYKFFKHHCPSRVGIASCETTQPKTCIRTEPVSFKYGFSICNSIPKCGSGALFPLYTPLHRYLLRSLLMHFVIWGLLRGLRAILRALAMTRTHTSLRVFLSCHL